MVGIVRGQRHRFVFKGLIMTIFAVFFDTTTGIIDLINEYEDGTSSTVIDADAPAGDAWLNDTTSLANIEEYYVANPGSTPVLTLRPVLTLNPSQQLQTDGVDMIDFALPNGTVVVFDETTWTSAGSEHFQMTSTIVGVYTITFDPPFPYMPLVLEVQCNAA